MIVPKTGRAGIAVNPGPNYTVKMIEDYPVPVPGKGQLLLKLNMTGLCLSDHHFMKGDWGIPMVCGTAGHEGSGVVCQLGPEVDPEVWKVGDRAGLKPVFDVCHECVYCREGMETHCDKAVFTGGAADGSYAQYVLSPARYTTRIPEGVPDAMAGPILCSGATVYTALKNTGARPGQWVVIPGGGGGVGHMGVQYAKALGLRVIAIDTGDEKRAMCMRLGAEHFVDFMTSGDVVAEVKKLTGGVGAHAVVVTGGTPGAYKGAADFLRKGGVQVCIGLPAAGTAMAGADPLSMIFNKLSIKGSLVGNQADTDEALDFAARGLIKPHITVIPFADLGKGLALLVASKVAGRLVVDFNA